MMRAEFERERAIAIAELEAEVAMISRALLTIENEGMDMPELNAQIDRLESYRDEVMRDIAYQQALEYEDVLKNAEAERIHQRWKEERDE